MKFYKRASEKIKNKQVLLAASGKPSTWLPLGGLIQQTKPNIEKYKQNTRCFRIWRQMLKLLNHELFAQSITRHALLHEARYT